MSWGHLRFAWWRKLCRGWSGSIQNRFVIGFSAATFLLMISAGYPQYERQKERLKQRDVGQAKLLATSLAKSTTYMVLANDLVGMHEVVSALSGTVDLERIFILSPVGEVLASTFAQENGLFVSDALSEKLLSAPADLQILIEQDNFIDVAAPILAANRHIGWVRVELVRDSSKADLRWFKNLWIAFTLMGLLLVILVTLLLSRRLTRGLKLLMKVTGEVAQGNREARATIEGSDEVAVLAGDFNSMLDTLHEIDLRFRQLAENIHQVFWMTDPAKKQMLYVSIAYEEIWGRTINSLFAEPQSWGDAIYQDDKARVLSKLSQQALGLYDEEYRIVRPNGEIRWVHDRAFPIKDATGVVYRVVGIAEDITERKASEELMRISAAAFETHEAIMIMDVHEKIVRVNKAFQEITGYNAEEVLGRESSFLSSGYHDKQFYKNMWNQLMQHGVWSGETWDVRKNGEIYPKWMTISAVKDSAGKATEYVAIFNDISARKKAEEEIRNLAFYDSLTQLPNRRLLMDRLYSALSTSARSNHYGALLFLDMDKFKTLNDTLGHDYGDLMLVEVSERIQACVREADTVARLGGDEFVVLLEEVSEHAEDASQKVAQVAEKIRAILAQPYSLRGVEYLSSPSVGVSLFRGNEDTAESLLKQADMAMYQVKDTGRNAVRFFDPLMQKSVETRASLEADLRRAVVDEQLQLHYQMQVDEDQKIIGAEALLRWMHPTRGMVSPAQFIPIAEESSLIVDIGSWVMETACWQLSRWSKNESTRDLTLAVNVSARQFKQVDFVEKTAALLGIYQVEASRLKLELTESVVLNDVDDVVGKMHALKALGVSLSMDDFGTGYSSLSYLKQLPLDQIKIDQSFVRDMTIDKDDIVMVQTIIDLAKNFRLNVIAEGVENESQLELLKHLGCMAFQGYLFSKPVPIGQFEALIKQR